MSCMEQKRSSCNFFTSCFFLFLILTLPYSSTAGGWRSEVALDSSKEMYEIDYRGPETHSSVPTPPHHSHANPPHSSPHPQRPSNHGKKIQRYKSMLYQAMIFGFPSDDMMKKLLQLTTTQNLNSAVEKLRKSDTNFAEKRNENAHVEREIFCEKNHNFLKNDQMWVDVVVVQAQYADNVIGHLSKSHATRMLRVAMCCQSVQHA
ncbi:hypothetical protein Ahy_B06g082278 [Arachis hypogaea]|uniref:UBA domain-containing protein n=1 Tax=Arachis hypogaea TaxID=3818 RepID=A0A444YN92_ARAHY|nr:hypothetical protein Ahy_B06g082278 [Arachis hypogaea]